MMVLIATTYRQGSMILKPGAPKASNSAKIHAHKAKFYFPAQCGGGGSTDMKNNQLQCLISLRLTLSL
jgi:hypothetical protein